MELKAVLRTRKESDRPRHNKRVMIGIERMQEHGLIAGDIVRLQLVDAKDDAPIAFGTAWPSFLGEDDEVQLSNVAMLNCQAQVGARLLVEKIAVVPAQATTVKVQFATPLSSDEFTRIYAKEVLVDVGCVTPNQLVDIMINGLNRRIRIISIEAEPGTMLTAGTPAMISRENTKVVVVKESDISDKEKQPVTYDSIGGLDKEVADVRQLVETSLQKPEIFAEYGLQPPRGVLLFGPPGTGKTLIARAVAGETQAYVHVINGAEIMNKYYGETEARLREIFEEARKQSPSIIFIDEIDALCPKRGDSESEASKRVVATLLTLMDGVSDRVNDRLVVIGATNRPNAIDSALRRPGRFDREIEVPIPNPEARLHILRKKLGNTPNSLTEEQIVALAASTHGFVGADIEALVREAAIIAIKRHTASELAADTESLAVTNDDVAAASRLIKPSTMREVTLEIPNVKWSDIGGQEETKQLLKES
ncbi:AAA+-type ATPase, partial [Linderina macrospora]